MHRYFILNKPVGIVSQFISTHDVGLLGDINFTFPESTHAIGRLDKNSEGLLLLTTDKKITRKIFLGTQPHKRTYLVMVQNEMSVQTLEKLKAGISIKIKNGEWHTAVPAAISIVKDAGAHYKFAADKREHYPHTWLLITLTEGKYHQVRKMMLAVRHRCIRLIRLSMENITIQGMEPGAVKEISMQAFYSGAGIALD